MTDKATKQKRRGKEDKIEPLPSIDEQIAKAKAAVHKSIATVNAMHIQWRHHLMRLSFMVVLIAMHQWQMPITSCLHDVKSYNRAVEHNNLQLSGRSAIYYILYYSFCEMLGVIMAVMLALFLRQCYNHAAVALVAPAPLSDGMATNQESFFTNKFYMVATGLVPPMVNLYFHIQSSSSSSARNSTNASCLDQIPLAQRLEWTRYAQDHGDAVRGFPVVLIFHIIATACCWFMDMQQSKQSHNLLALDKLKQELTTTKMENDSKKKK